MQRTRFAKKKWDNERRQVCRDIQRKVKAKQRVYNEFSVGLDRREGDTDLYRLSRQRDRDGNYI